MTTAVGYPHFLNSETQGPDGSWVQTGRTPCTCKISENHWVERPVTKEKVS